MGLVKFEDLPKKIMGGINIYERGRIKTEGVKLYKKFGDIAYFYAYKSDETISLFIARPIRKGSKLWCHWCVTENQSISLVNNFPIIKKWVDRENKKNRKSIK